MLPINLELGSPLRLREEASIGQPRLPVLTPLSWAFASAPLAAVATVRSGLGCPALEQGAVQCSVLRKLPCTQMHYRKFIMIIIIITC